ncbi:MAG: dihydroorotate dehydrogenase-like protein [Gammaproteobacteria bacterium]|nr:dihydroorotate dehydrogenase-like protein [Gammaproteobacteria bacterium]
MQAYYLGLSLKNPIIVSSNPLSEKIDYIKNMEKAGAAAIVMYSIFAEEIHYDDEFVDYYREFGTEKFAESLTYFPNLAKQSSFLDYHLHHLEQAVKAVNIPIIGSLNATSKENWFEYALKMQETGISALEINLFTLPIKPKSSELIEQEYISIVKDLKAALNIPLVVKLSPYFTSITDIALALDKIAHVDGLILFNRFYHPDFDIDQLKIKTDIQLSNPYEARLPLRWIAILYDQIKASIAGSTGVHSSDDVIKYILAGAHAITCASCLLQNGIPYIDQLTAGLEKWMKTKNFKSIDQFRGLMSYKKISHPTELERAQYMKALRSFKHDELY